MTAGIKMENTVACPGKFSRHAATPVTTPPTDCRTGCRFEGVSTDSCQLLSCICGTHWLWQKCY
jgi:hypothetical protein